MNPYAVSIRELRRNFGLAFTLGPVSLNIPRGSICALVGPNGAGKTTLMNLLAGIGVPDGGSATLLDYDVRASEVEVKRRVAYVSPDLSYRAWGTVGRALDFVSGFYPDWNADHCERLQHRFGIHRSEHIDSLSFGARTKLATLMALSRNAELLLLDEPTAGLDPLAREELFAELLRFMQDETRTIVISSHQLGDLERFADHVAIMKEGQVIASGAIPDLLERYVQLDIAWPEDGRPAPRGLNVIRSQEGRARLLLDRSLPRPLAPLGFQVIGESTLTLEELFVALMKSSKTRWQPKLSAA